ncbi:MAG: adenosine-specific kinase [Aminobacterium sp.]|jgi:adenosine/AMP kinase|uniref:adenosine-specific kinase n=1 Tax=unclassified Aminobacterium TaxID=2685012 RepID=UPI001BCCEA15|nr:MULTISPECIES: adenosine-specific kinase [unclassified Aminobacterium]MDD2206483.1 adenosine-specific kinase [Aminobacterium sp.]MDD3426278.1 adenosine-specific kinase [Aminobacterium sp.]MDD3706974.1 adenosine-specific kinase [Aminobacterium sp.]MDD4228401.1 adenosine-specific kinase [Aminobacterium sp.]MDD4551324.1 adenosine-specific kinase [Aminobacterium sp.]
MTEIKKWELVQMEFPEDCNIIIGQSHFIKTVEDLYEALITSSPSLEFGIAFCEASGDCLIRYDGNADDLKNLAIKNVQKLSAGHTFVILLRNGYPINVLDRIKNCQEVCRVFAATANPIQTIVCESEQGRGIAGVIDGFMPVGVEGNDHIQARKKLLRDIIGYKR